MTTRTGPKFLFDSFSALVPGMLKIPTKVGKMKEAEMPLSGKEMVRVYEKAGWEFVRQTGSHVRMRKGEEYATIPMHKELATGTEHKLLKILEGSL